MPSASARVHVDSRGAPIFPGAKVAYNLAGSVVEGRVLKATPVFKIELQHDAARGSFGHVSRVRRAHSILVLP